MMIFRAQQDVPANTELKFGYVGGFEDYTERQKALEKYGFKCECSICKAQRTSTPELLAARENIMREIITTFEKPVRTPLETYYALFDRLEQTYESPPRLEPRRTYVVVLPSLITSCAHDKLTDEVVRMGLMLLRALGFELNVTDKKFEVTYWGLMCDELVPILADIWTAYGTVQPELVRDVETVLRKCYCILAGEEVSFAGAYGACEPDMTEEASDPEMRALVERVRNDLGVSR